MWDIAEVKAKGRLAFKANYWRCVVAALLAWLFAGGCVAYSSSSTSGSPEADAFLNNASPEQLATLLAVLGSVSLVIIIIGLLIKIFISNPIEVGCARFFKKNIDDQTTTLGTIGEGFSDFGHVFVTLFLRDLFTFLWSLLFIIPGIVAAYSYRMVPYILKDNPELSAMEAIGLSKELMYGNRWKAFVMDLTFIGWAILGILTLGIVWVFWTGPYMESTDAALYLELKNRG